MVELTRWQRFLHWVPGFMMAMDPPGTVPRRSYVVFRPRAYLRNWWDVNGW